ncbi:MAG: hypothetical protein AAF938_05630 [Myxococcota bacterium]
MRHLARLSLLLVLSLACGDDSTPTTDVALPDASPDDAGMGTDSRTDTEPTMDGAMAADDAADAPARPDGGDAGTDPDLGMPLPFEEFRLPEGHFVPRQVDPVLVFPRPDDETPAWAKHRRHHPGVPYRIPIGVAFGSWPFYFESVDLPDGCAVGSFLVEDGDELVVGPDYGVVSCASPSEGTYAMHVRVHFQDDHPAIDVEWTLEVTQEGTIVIDPRTGSDVSGDGSIESPFRTVEAWWRGDPQDRAFSGYQVLYRGGRHNAAVNNEANDVSGANWRLASDDKPLVHYGYPGEDVVFDMRETTIAVNRSGAIGDRPSGSDAFFGGITFDSGPTARDNPRIFAWLTGTSSPREYAANGAGSRNTWFEVAFQNYVCDTAAGENAGVFWTPNPGGDNWRHFFLVSRVRFDGVRSTGSCGSPNWNGFYVSKPFNLLEEHTRSFDTQFGRGSALAKSTGMFMCHRNLDHSQSPEMRFFSQTAGSYDSSSAGPIELSYSRIGRTSEGRTDAAVFQNSANRPFPDSASAFPIYQFRNSLSRAAERGLMTVGGNPAWPVFVRRDLWASDVAFNVRNTNANEADDDDFVLVPVVESPFDSDLNLQGSARETYLGTFGAQLAR